MRNFVYMPTVDEHNKPLVIKVRIIGEKDGWRMLHVAGQEYKGEEEIVVHQRHLTDDWMAAWLKAKRISRFRASVRNGKLRPMQRSNMASIAGIGSLAVFGA